MNISAEDAGCKHAREEQNNDDLTHLPADLFEKKMGMAIAKPTVKPTIVRLRKAPVDSCIVQRYLAVLPSASYISS
jgi:hypothetical protein